MSKKYKIDLKTNNTYKNVPDPPGYAPHLTEVFKIMFKTIISI